MLDTLRGRERVPRDPRGGRRPETETHVRDAGSCDRARKERRRPPARAARLTSPQVLKLRRANSTGRGWQETLPIHA